MARFTKARLSLVSFAAVTILGLLTFSQLSPAFATVGTPITSTTSTLPSGYGYQGRIYNAASLWWNFGVSDGSALTCETSSDSGATWTSPYGIRSQGATTQGSYFATYYTPTTFSTIVPTVSSIGAPSGGATKSFYYNTGILSSSGCAEASSLGTIITTGAGTGTTDTLNVPDVISGDVLVIGTTSEAAIASPATATVADGGDVFTSRSTTSLSNTCLAGNSCYVNIFTATAGSSSASLAVTVTWSVSTAHQSFAYDTHGYKLSGLTQNTGSSTSCASTCSASVSSFSPTSGSIVISAIAITNAGSNTVGTGFISAGTANIWGVSEYLQSSSGAQTAPWSLVGASGNPVGYAEAALGLSCTGTCSGQETTVTTTNNVVDGAGPSVIQDANGVTFVSIETNDGTSNHIELWKCTTTCTTPASWSKVYDVGVGILENGIVGIYGSGIYLLWRTALSCGGGTCHQISLVTSTNEGVSWSSQFNSGVADPSSLRLGGVAAAGPVIMVAVPCLSSDNGGCASPWIVWEAFNVNTQKWDNSIYSYTTTGYSTISWDTTAHSFFSFFFDASSTSLLYVTNDTDTEMNSNMFAIATSTVNGAAVVSSNVPVDPPAVLWRAGANSPYSVKDALLASYPLVPNETPHEFLTVGVIPQSSSAALHQLMNLVTQSGAGNPANHQMVNLYVCLQQGGIGGPNIGGACVSAGQPVAITIVTSPSTLINALTIDGVTYGAGAHVFNWNVGSNHTLVAQPTALGAGLIMYSFTSWSDGGAASHTFTAPMIPTTVVATYGSGGSGPPSGGSCNTQNLETALNTGCSFGVVFFFWFGIFGPWLLAFLDFLPALGIYIRTESPAAAAGVYVLIDVVLVSGLIAANFPAALSTVGPGILGAVIAGSVFQLVRSSKGG